MYRLYKIFVYFYQFTEFFRILSFVLDLKYLSQNSINFNMLGVFWFTWFNQSFLKSTVYLYPFLGLDIVEFLVYCVLNEL